MLDGSGPTRSPRTTTLARLGRRGRHWALVAAAALVSAPLLPLGSAQAALSSVGPEDPATKFPAFYTDSNGLALELCLGLPSCLSDSDLVAVHAAGGDAEAFYYAADAEVGPFTLHLALEAAYAADGADQEIVFQRTEIRARDGDLPANTTYTVTDPYGTYTCTTDGSGVIDSNGCRLETTPVEREFGRALNGRIGPFLTLAPGTPAPPAGYIGDNATPLPVVGSPTGFNAFRVSGPDIAGTCQVPGGTAIPNCLQTDRFVLQGKLAPGSSASVSQGVLDFGDVPTSPPVTKRLTYANTGTTPVAIAGVAISGGGASAFGHTSTCPGSLPVGGTCAIDVTFTPQAGAASSATLTIADDTPAGSKTVQLRGSNLGEMTSRTTGLAFGSQQVGTVSVEDHAVVENTGQGPLTVATASIVGPSSSHFRLGANGCAASVAPETGCEVAVRFAPTTTGSKSATLRLTDASGASVDVPLTGTGTTAPANTAPTITSVAPQEGATGVGVSAVVSATFDEAVQGVPSSFTLRNASGALVGASVTRDGTTNRWVLDPSASLASGARYTATVTTGVTDTAGLAMAAPRTWSFSTAAAAGDTTAPRVTARAPADAGTRVGVSSNVTATFSEAVQGVSGASFVLRNAAGAQVAAGVSRNGTTNQWILNPTASLAADTRYTATLTGGASAIRDAAGNVLPTTSWTFLTGPAPVVSARTPGIGATGTSRTANATATFSERVQGVSGSTATLRNASTGATVSAVVSYNATTRVATLNPSSTLAARTQYRVTLTTGIRDTAGNPLAANVTWTYTTGG